MSDAEEGARLPRGQWWQQKPEPHHVTTAYRWLLGRSPDGEEAIEDQISRANTIAEMRARIMASAEFRSQIDDTVLRPLPLALPREEIESRASPAVLATLMGRMARIWTALGERSPHWSVLTEDRFRPASIEANLGVFRATASTDLGIVRSVIERHGLAAEAPRLLDYGCGVGRATLALAPLFADAVGCDISPPHLALAAAEAEARGVANVAWHQATAEAPMPEGGWDVWFSRLVLQHNPPPVIRHLLGLAFAGLRPGGLVIFQLPVHGRGYRFDIGEYLAEGEGGMELHALPQPEVFALAREAGLELLELREDSHMTMADPSAWLSNLFVFRRPAGG
jgi:SAM-dependent methyltransferase